MRGEGQGEAETPMKRKRRGSSRSYRMREMGTMQPRRASRNHGTATRARRMSLDLTDKQDAIDLRMLEVLERIERVQSMALRAAGTLLAGQR